MKPVRQFVILIIMSISLSGCIGAIVAHPGECKNETPNINIHNVFWNVKRLENTRHSTKAEFLKAWGKPDRIEKTADGLEIWIYNRKLWCGVIPFFIAPAPFVLPVCDGFDRIEFEEDSSVALHTRHTLWEGGFIVLLGGFFAGADKPCRRMVSGADDGKAVSWIYKSETFIEQKPVIGKAVEVPPFADKRPNVNKNTVYLALIPFVPFGSLIYDKPEMESPFVGSARWNFRPQEDLAQAVAEELRNSGIFKEAFFTNMTGDGDLALKGIIESTRYHGTLITYGVSVPAFLLWMIGFPSGTADNELQLNLQLVDQKTGAVIWEKDYRKADYRVSFIYYVKPDFFYDDLLKQIMKEAIPDIRDRMKEYPVK
jgi:hypothetical protein